jgi:aromatic ring hydroxylase
LNNTAKESINGIHSLNKLRHLRERNRLTRDYKDQKNATIFLFFTIRTLKEDLSNGRTLMQRLSYEDNGIIKNGSYDECLILPQKNIKD